MSDEKIIMDKEDYHNIKNILDDVSKCDSDVEDYVFDINVLLDKAEPYDQKQKVKVYSRVIQATKMRVQCTLIVGNEEPIIFSDRSLFDAEIKRRGINLTDIEYYHDITEGDK